MFHNNKISQLQQQLSTFFNSNEKESHFIVDCELKYRIKFIYKVIFPGLKRYFFYFRFFIARIAYFIDFSPVKVAIYRMLGIKIGKGVFISPNVYIDVHFPKLIFIDDYVILGHGVSIFCHDFIYDKYRLGRIHIGEGAVIGAYTNIGCGVTICERANVRVRSLVLKDINSIKQ